MNDIVKDVEEYRMKNAVVDNQFIQPLIQSQILSLNDQWTLFSNFNQLVDLTHKYSLKWKEVNAYAVSQGLEVGEVGLGRTVLNMVRGLREYQTYYSMHVASSQMFARLLVCCAIVLSGSLS